MDGPATRIVNCDGCRLCCMGEAIMLHPEHGDDKRDYTTVVATNPQTGLLAYFIPQKDGACLYLGDTGCTIWDKRPVTCRVFDCAEMVAKMPRHVRRQRIRDGLISAEMVERGSQVLRARGGKA